MKAQAVLQHSFGFHDEKQADLLTSSTLVEQKTLFGFRILATVICLVVGIILPWSVSQEWSMNGFRTIDSNLNDNNVVQETVPPVFYFHAWTGIIGTTYFVTASVSSFYATYKSQVKRKNFLSWILYEIFCPWTIVSLAFYFGVYLPSSNSSSDELVPSISQVVLVLTMIVEFTLNSVSFKGNHISLVMCAPSAWCLMEIIWIYTGHRNAYDNLSFATWTSVAWTAVLMVGFAMLFICFKLVVPYKNNLFAKTRRLHKPHSEAPTSRESGGVAILHEDRYEELRERNLEPSASSRHLRRPGSGDSNPRNIV